MLASQPRVPEDLDRNFVLACVRSRDSGVRLCLSLGYVDETVEPSRPGLFEHEWLISDNNPVVSGEFEPSFAAVPRQEQAAFREQIEQTLREDGTYLVRNGSDLVLRSAAP
jgi:hypothetical protein